MNKFCKNAGVLNMYLYHSDNIAARHKKVIENSDLIIKIQDGLSQNDVIILR